MLCHLCLLWIISKRYHVHIKKTPGFGGNVKPRCMAMGAAIPCEIYGGLWVLDTDPCKTSLAASYIVRDL